ncbi:hypothetical protein EVAR_74752_1 [Eumeta japonica]|uniref:Uncharacterized protein n=1 Tax=Eumeta variegata TaxID=151549 RepID=A0A4C1SPS5_EUMVA|nr:hypothetical protein EVAR_74752_1 [Eumeta japonica]
MGFHHSSNTKTSHDHDNTTVKVIRRSVTSQARTAVAECRLASAPPAPTESGAASGRRLRRYGAGGVPSPGAHLRLGLPTPLPGHHATPWKHHKDVFHITRRTKFHEILNDRKFLVTKIMDLANLGSRKFEKPVAAHVDFNDRVGPFIRAALLTATPASGWCADTSLLYSLARVRHLSAARVCLYRGPKQITLTIEPFADRIPLTAGLT